MTPPINPLPNDLPGDDLHKIDRSGDVTDEQESAWYDRELTSVESAPADSSLRAPNSGRLQDYQRLTQLLQSLPVEPLPADFASQVIARLPDTQVVLRPQSTPMPAQSGRNGDFRRLSKPLLGCLAASLAGLVLVVGRWQPFAPSDQFTADSQLAAPSGAKLGTGATPMEMAFRPSLASQLEEIPPEKLAIVRIRVPQRGAVSETETAAMNLTVQAFGEHSINQVPEGPRLAKRTAASPDSPPVAPRAAGSSAPATSEVPDHMQLLVVGESEAIVQAIEQLLRNLEQTELEEEIRAVARTELDQLPSELNPSLGQYLDNLEQTWSPAQLASERLFNRGMPPSRSASAAESTLPGQTQDRVTEPQSRSRGSMAWVPPESIPLPSPSGALETAEATRPAGRSVEIPSSEAKRAISADQPARAAMGGRARPPEYPKSLLERSSSAADKAPGTPPESDSVEGRRPRRVLIQLICDPAG